MIDDDRRLQQSWSPAAKGEVCSNPRNTHSGPVRGDWGSRKAQVEKKSRKVEPKSRTSREKIEKRRGKSRK